MTKIRSIEELNMKLQEMPLVKNTKLILNEIWNRENKNTGFIFGDEFKYLFGLRLFQYAQGKHYDYTSKILPNSEEERTKIINIYRKRRGSSSSSISKQFQRLGIGYNSLTYEFTPKRCNLSSYKANIDYKKKTASDHIIGATLCSQYVIDIFQTGIESNKDKWVNMDWLDDKIDYMCNEWLKDNLWLWAQCRITNDEHNPKNGLSRNMIQNSTLHEEILYRANFEHYKNAEIKVCDYENITS